MHTTTVADQPKGKGFFGHPPGLSTLFFTEMWERFSYYGMRAILALYLYTVVTEGGLGMDEPTAVSLVLAYGASVYLTGVAGGWLADRVFGAQRAIFYGGVLIMLGHICMALPGGYSSLAAGLGLIVLGSGLLKPNVSNVVGGLYSKDDYRRDAGFSIFYTGINIGAFIGMLITAALADRIGFHWGFGAAAVGMALGLIQYVLGNARLGNAGKQPVNPLPEDQKSTVLVRAAAIAVALVVVLVGATFLWGVEGLINTITGISIALPALYFTVMFRSRQITKMERDRLTAYIPLFLATALFFLLFEQQAATLVVVTDFQTDTTLFGYDFPVGWFQSINPLAIIILAPLFALLWVKWGDRQPSTPMKFVGGLTFVALGFLWVIFSGLFRNGEGLMNPLMIAFVFVLFTIGELMLSPVGLSVTTKLAPQAFSSQTMGLYFLAPALGQGVASQIAQLYSEENQNLYFGGVGLVTLALAGVLALGTPWIKRYMHGVN
ncbi:POT family proton-dependent oligopeptide transporter [Halopolyspora algeriensis]|uniref:POT family proton-dependent oligopeptide transporter n=1 Tax=Halopolyspora algeriensis TaxID=1500506 RepID=A0A368VCA4_9ACTN|nr:POT family proton-dependent oligopeptide transporter [Halopolyspora algeriensis]TQM55735.1 POT family proton-dependent oligopeptide transporter [Halopolyspora algeriensis]